MILPQHTIEQFKTIIESSKRFIILVHTNPDGDALGSAFGWHNLFINLDKISQVISPNDSPETFSWFNDFDHLINFQKEELKAHDAFSKADVLLCVDFNGISRVEELRSLIENFNGKKLMVDHHPFPQAFTDEMISYPEASSTSEISYRIMCDLGYRHLITKQVAEALYTGVLTDTGGLNHNSSNPETYHTMADLLTCGINKSEIHDYVLNSYPESRMRLMGDILSKNLRVLYTYNTAYIFITESQQKFYNFSPGDSEGFVNIPLSIKGIKFCAMFTETTDHVKVSLRSKGTFPANKFASEYFNGGGHLNAAGGRIAGKLFDAMHLFEEGVRAYKDLLSNS